MQISKLAVIAPLWSVNVCLLSVGLFAKEKSEIEVLASDRQTSSYDIPARAACIPGAQGPLCGFRGAETATVGFVRLNAKLNGIEISLTCDTTHEKHYTQFLPGKYLAEAKGKDKVVLYGWANPLYRGNFSKATKVTFRIGSKPQ